MIMNCGIHDGCVPFILDMLSRKGWRIDGNFYRWQPQWMFESMSPRIEAESEHRHYGSIELYASQEPSVGAHPVAFLQLLYNEVKSPQDNPLDSTVTLLQGVDSAGELAH